MAWRCKICECEVIEIETVNRTSTYEVSRTKKRGKLVSKARECLSVGYICINDLCKNNDEYAEKIEDIADWEEN